MTNKIKFILAVSIVLLSAYLSYHQVVNGQVQHQNNTNAIFMKYKGQFYCYDSDTTTKKEVVEAIKEGWIESGTEIQNEILTAMAEPDNPNNITEKTESLGLATELCQGMVDDGKFTNEDYNDYIEGTLTLEIK